MAQGTRQTNSLFLWSLLEKAEENYLKESEEPCSTRKGSCRTLAWVCSQAAGDGWVALSEEGKLQLGPDGPGPGDSEGDGKGTSGEQRNIPSEGGGSGT